MPDNHTKTKAEEEVRNQAMEEAKKESLEEEMRKDQSDKEKIQTLEHEFKNLQEKAKKDPRFASAAQEAQVKVQAARAANTKY